MVSTVVESNTSTHEYLYDVNGNMKEDKNKGITVVYNYLNLPIQVNFGPNNRIDWTYTATGAKLQKKVYTNGTLTLTQDYVSGFVYKNGSLEFFFTSQGRVKKTQSGTLQYEYDFSDHLGNTRVMFADADNNGVAEVLEESHYYAFGMRIEGLSTSSPDNKFTYNGKELEDDHGLNWYHYGARFYDAQIGRWHVVDPLSQYLSPYQYVGNDPLNYHDPDGTWGDPDDEGGLFSSLLSAVGNFFSSSTQQGQEQNEALQNAAQVDRSANRILSNQVAVNTALVETHNTVESVKETGSTVMQATREFAKTHSTVAKVAGVIIIAGGAIAENPVIVGYGVDMFTVATASDVIAATASTTDALVFNGSASQAGEDMTGVGIDLVAGGLINGAAARYLGASNAMMLPQDARALIRVTGQGLVEGINAAAGAVISIPDIKK